jgi:hypothetical protein
VEEANIEALEILSRGISECKERWEERLRIIRDDFYDMNDFFSDQIVALDDFFNGVHDIDSVETKSLISLIRLI